MNGEHDHDSLRAALAARQGPMTASTADGSTRDATAHLAERLAAIRAAESQAEGSCPWTGWES